MFDITKVAAIETSIVKLLDGADEPLLDDNGEQLTITVYGPGSKPYAKAQAKRNNKIVERLKKKGKAETSSDEAADEAADFLAACTVSFNGWSYPPAAKLGDFHHFKAAYADQTLGFIRDQVSEHIGDWANFTNASPKS